MRSSVLAGVQPRHFNQIRMDAVESAMFLPCLGNGGAFNFIQLTVFYFKGSKGSSGNNDKKNSTNDLGKPSFVKKKIFCEMISSTGGGSD